jgi:hypothetical protein
MAEPFNYNIASPLAAFEGSYNFARAEQAARDKQALQLAEQQKVQTALQSIMNDRTPENIARNLLLVPSIKEQVAASESILNEAERTSANQLRSEVIGLFKAGNIDAAKARLAAQAEGYARTPGKEREAAASRDLLKTFDIDPESVIMPMTIQLAQSDEKLYKNLFENAELTAFQKDQRAAGVDPMSKEGVEQAEQYLQLKIDPIVEMVTPDNTKFVGPRSEYFKRYGSNAQKPAAIAPPEAIRMLLTGEGTPAQFDAIFGEGMAEQYLKIRGGPTSTKQSGNFQGQ